MIGIEQRDLIGQTALGQRVGKSGTHGSGANNHHLSWSPMLVDHFCSLVVVRTVFGNSSTGPLPQHQNALFYPEGPIRIHSAGWSLYASGNDSQRSADTLDNLDCHGDGTAWNKAHGSPFTSFGCKIFTSCYLRQRNTNRAGMPRLNLDPF